MVGFSSAARDCTRPLQTMTPLAAPLVRRFRSRAIGPGAAARALGALGGLVASGCVTNHDLFAASDGAGGAGTGGGPATGGLAQYVTGGAHGGDAQSGAGGHAGPVEPPGPLAISFVNGVTDAPWVSLCFTKVENGVESPATGMPFPAGALGYGNSTTVASIPGVNFATDAVRPYVVAASPDAISGLNCGSILVIAGTFGPSGAPGAGDASSRDGAPEVSPDAARDANGSRLDAASRGDARNPVDAAPNLDATRVDARSAGDGASDASRREGGGATDAAKTPVPIIRVAPLYVIPAGTFGASHHYLFALGGCVGGPGISDPSELSVCGDTFSASHPTITPVLVTLSRVTTSGHVGIQFVDATPAVRAADLRLTSAGLIPLSIAKNVVVGAIRPNPPNATRTSPELGPTDHVQIFADGSSTPIYDQPWSKTLAVGDIAALEDGQDYTLLLVGPYPGFAEREWWNDPLVTVVKNLP